MKEPFKGLDESLKDILSELKGIITAAGSNDKTLIALGITTLFIVTVIFFTNSSELIKFIAYLIIALSIFLLMILGQPRIRSILQDKGSKIKYPFSLENSQHYSISRDEKIYEDGIKYLLQKKSRESVLIYAPTGVWHYDPEKSKWFKAIAKCLTNHLSVSQSRLLLHVDKSVNTKLREFVGLYGLPFRVPRDGDPLVNYTPVELSKFSEIMDEVELMFLPFSGLSNAKIFRLLGDARSISGSGAIIFEDAVFLGFATGGIDKIDYGIFFQNKEDVCEPVNKWFRTHMQKIIDYEHPIQNMDEPYCIEMHQGMNNIRTAIGLQPKLY